MAKRSNEPFLWILFSAGGVIAALLVPILLFLFGLAFPLGWLDAPSYERVLTLAGLPLARVCLIALCSLSLFHWAHRFRFTLIDLGLHSLETVIAVACYGGAIVGTGVAIYVVWL